MSKPVDQSLTLVKPRSITRNATMITRNRRLPLPYALLGALLLLRGISHLRHTGLTSMPSGPADAAAYGYAFGYSLGISLQLLAGAGLLMLSARQWLAGRGKQI